MNTGVKRIVILFSVALNIGFISMAAYQFFQPSKSRSQRYWNELMVIVDDMKLPKSQKTELVDRLFEFTKNYKALGSRVRQTKRETMVFLADPAPLKMARLHELGQNSQNLAREKQEMFQAHVTELNSILGDELRASYFHHLLENKKKRYSKKR